MALFLIALVIAAGAVFTHLRAAANSRAAETQHPPEGQILDVDGVPVHVVVRGQGPDVVLIHGAGGNTRDWTLAFADRLTDRYRVLIFDRPGLGYTGRTDPSYARAFTTRAESPGEQAALLSKAAAQLGAEAPVVVGHSYGGAVALAWALEHPISAMVNVAGVANPWPGKLDLLYRVNGTALGGAVLVPMIAAYVPDTVIDSTLEAIFAPDPVPARYNAHVAPRLSLRTDSYRANTRQVNTLRPHVVEMAARYGSITVPTEIIHGDADTIVPLIIHADPLSRQIPGAQLTVIEGAGHMPQHAYPAAVEAAIDRAAARAGLR